jgi:hypothetical protein
LIVVVIAWKALSVWKSEIRGRDKYKLAKELLEYIKELRFLVYFQNKSGKSWHQIYLNDILVDQKKFYNDQLFLVGKEKIYFDQSILGLFKNVNTRSNIFLPKQIRSSLEELSPHHLIRVSLNESQHTYMRLGGIKTSAVKSIENGGNSKDVFYDMYEGKNLTIEDYFKKWENLILELKKIL